MGLAVEKKGLNCFQYGVGVFGDRVASSEGINKIAKLGITIISLVGKVLGALSEGWQALSNTLKGVAYFLDVTDIITRIVEWVKGEVVGAWKIASRVFLTVFRVFGLIEFLEKVKLINLRTVVEKLGNVPVLGWIINLPIGLLGVCSYSLSMVHYSLETRKHQLKVNLAENRRIALDARQQAASTGSTDELKNIYCKAIKEIRSAKLSLGLMKSEEAQIDDENIAMQWDDRNGNDEVNELQTRIEESERELSNAVVKRGKSIVSIINDVFKVAIIALSLLGLIFGGLLLATSLPMLIFGVATAAMGLYKCFHEAVAKDYVVKLNPFISPKSAFA